MGGHLTALIRGPFWNPRVAYFTEALPIFFQLFIHPPEVWPPGDGGKARRVHDNVSSNSLSVILTNFSSRPP
jgi:hypothetical protein